MRSQRQLRVGEELRHVLAQALERGDAPWPKGFLAFGPVPTITVTEVQVSPDLKNASVFAMPLGGQRAEETVKALNEIVGFFRHTVAQNVKLRYVPKLKFVLDESFDYASKIDMILHDPAVAKDLKTPEGSDEG